MINPWYQYHNLLCYLFHLSPQYLFLYQQYSLLQVLNIEESDVASIIVQKGYFSEAGKTGNKLDTLVKITINTPIKVMIVSGKYLKVKASKGINPISTKCC